MTIPEEKAQHIVIPNSFRDPPNTKKNAERKMLKEDPETSSG